MSSKNPSSENTVLLIGPPNVGKSVFFNYFTDLNVGMANYAGTTVEYTVGNAVLSRNLEGSSFQLIDVPGTYTLEATNAAEKVAVDLLEQKPKAVLCVLDAVNLESSLYLLLQVLKKEIPTVVALNRIDLAVQRGFSIDHKFLSSKLGVPIIPTVAVTGDGIEKLEEKMTAVIANKQEPETIQKKIQNKDNNNYWQLAEEWAEESKQKKYEDTTFSKEKWDSYLTSPWPGLLFALLILITTFSIVVGIGLGLRQFILLPLFRGTVIPAVISLVHRLVSPGLLREIMAGEYGFLVKGLEWPFALVLPYVISFYAALTLLEDSGYLPRLGILLDGLLNRIGLAGSNIIPLLLGYGCAIPGILAARAMSSKKERLMIAFMISLAVPCIAQTGAFISLLSAASLWAVPAVFLFSFAALTAAGLIMDRLLPGERKSTLMEIPELLWPRPQIAAKKIWIRIKNFVFEGALPMVIGVGIAAVLYETGAIIWLGEAMRPLVTEWLGLPQEAAVPLVLGVLRRELAVLPLLEMELSFLQLFVGSVVALFYVPCIATLAVLIREFNSYVAVGILMLTTTTAFLGAGLIMRAGLLIGGLV